MTSVGYKMAVDSSEDVKAALSHNESFWTHPNMSTTMQTSGASTSYARSVSMPNKKTGTALSDMPTSTPDFSQPAMCWFHSAYIRRRCDTMVPLNHLSATNAAKRGRLSGR